MQDTQNVETPAVAEREREGNSPATVSRRAAAIEAAYILEAVRK